jgi:hypothetical protein
VSAGEADLEYLDENDAPTPGVCHNPPTRLRVSDTHPLLVITCSAMSIELCVSCAFVRAHACV